MTYEQIFIKIKEIFKKAKTSDFTAEFAFQFNITGEGEGIFYVSYKNGVLAIEPYDYNDNDAIFTADAETLIKIAEGTFKPADAINSGKLFVDGNNQLAKQFLFLLNNEAKTKSDKLKSDNVKKGTSGSKTKPSAPKKKNIKK